MLSLYGTGVGRTIAIGQAYVIDNAEMEIPQYDVPLKGVESEVRRFKRALNNSRRQLIKVKDKIPSDAPSESVSFINAHLLMLKDKLLVDESVKVIHDKRINAEAALQKQSRALINVFEEMEDPYLRNKKVDIEQVVNRVLRNLMGLEQHALDQHNKEDLQGKIIVARDLSPAETVLLNDRGVIAFITDLGGPISHTAIVARSLHIPASVGLHGATRYIHDGETVIVDGRNGVVAIGADEGMLKACRKLQRSIRREIRALSTLKTARSRTRDGENISLKANIEMPDDIRAAKRVNADGVGLYRTEYLYMNRAGLPTEDEQLIAYRRVIRSINKHITFRTLDVGGDKRFEGTGVSDEAGTSPLGMRAVRLCLQNPDIFRPQLRAILRASAYGPASILIPMLTNLAELRQVKEMIAEIKSDLRKENRQYDRRIPIGGMMEVPAAAINADMFAAELDFLSIGTNDLIQYTLAIDRVDDAVNYLYDPLNSAVLRLIRTIIRSAEKAGIPVTMCGEMAGNTAYTRLLLGLGLRTFSMAPSSLLEVKKIVLESDIGSMKNRVARIVNASDASKVRDMVSRLNQL